MAYNSEHVATIADLKLVAQKAKDEANNITTSKLANDAVTTAKMANNSVTTAKLVDSSVTASKIADGVITRDKLETSLRNAYTIATDEEVEAMIAEVNTASDEEVDDLLDDIFGGGD